MNVKLDKYIIVALSLVVAVCSLPVLSNVFKLQDLIFESSAAFLGICISVIITGIMLKSQSNAENEKERNAKIFEQKLNIYLDFLRGVSDVAEDGHISKKEANRLQFLISFVAMHTSDSNMRLVSEPFAEIVELCGGVDVESKVIELQDVLQPLMQIVTVFRRELYPKEAPQMEASDELEAAVARLKSVLKSG